mmetsp:Transcript_9191/g.22576  ORF Transcript_9191/g.22576 Transcript_9191/m.22576 type:complete len:109 (-) Transcript_9191:386-712(-)
MSSFSNSFPKGSLQCRYYHHYTHRLNLILLISLVAILFGSLLQFDAGGRREALIEGSNKTFKVKMRLRAANKRNREVPAWLRVKAMVTGKGHRFNTKRRNWRYKKLKI